MGKRDKVVRAQMTEAEKREWEQYKGRVGPNLSHRDGMLKAAEAAEYLEDQWPQAFREAFR